MVGLGRIDGRPVGIVANNSAVRGGVLFVDSADKAARFIWLCDAFNVPLLYLADVPGFMIGSEVERQGIIRHGAKMITAMSEATVPQLSIIVRKAYGAGLYAMNGPGFEPDACIALTTARIAVMGPEAAVNAVYANKIAELAAGRARRVRGRPPGRVPRGRRPVAAGRRPGHRRDHHAAGTARADHRPVRGAGRQVPSAAGEAPRGAAGMTHKPAGMTPTPAGMARVHDLATAEEIAAVLAALDAAINASRSPLESPRAATNAGGGPV